jgi:hypothetical protein
MIEMTAPNGTATLAEARTWLLAKADRLAESGKSFPEGVTVSARGRLSSAAKLYYTKQTRKAIVTAPPTAPSGIKAKIEAFVASGGTLPEGVTVKAGRGRLSKAASDFAKTL